MNRVAVSNSTVVTSLGYDAKQKIMEVTFKSGSTYQYMDVPTATAKAVFTAPSIGKAFCRTVKGKFSSDKIDD